jgi:hypothetical protein
LLSGWTAAVLGTAVRAAAKKVRRVDLEVRQPSLDVRVTTSSDAQAQFSQQLRDRQAVACGYRGKEPAD